MSERLGPDPLDPHGDGTIHPTDPLWQMLLSGDAVHATRDPGDPNEWDVTRLPAWAGGDGAGRGDALSPQGDDPDRRTDHAEGVAVFRGLIAALIVSAALYIAAVTVAAVWLVVTQ